MVIHPVSVDKSTTSRKYKRMVSTYSKKLFTDLKVYIDDSIVILLL